ncbi:excisionase family DNA binding protein [Kitasatospora sp. MAA19]|uniref:helix-turn-helix domain-containing protein n=1 Tax=Kitasatospora sp. MAA19 TaxID=3035090 RepID=UPI002476D42A|nr:helix-turn-helix domain-containing protein [Kitasatospora sp. MAA19]MDH6705336.1 excisionase family DNA binding protein [Kitasatospora sp. MAA19]
MTTIPPLVLEVPEVMTALRMSRSKVYDLIRAKKLESFTEGRLRRIPVTALHDYLRTKKEENA